MIEDSATEPKQVVAKKPRRRGPKKPLTEAQLMRRRETNLDYYYRNREKIAARNSAKYHANVEKQSERNRLNYIKNRERILGYKRKHREAHRAEHNARLRAIRAAAPEPAHSYLGKYGMTIAEYRAMFSAQGGVCAICQKGETTRHGARVRRLAVDHCHKTGRMRALLCTACNVAIGRLGDDPDLLDRASAYLRLHRAV